MSEEPSQRLLGALFSLGESRPATERAERFRDRRDAGRRLASLLEPLRKRRPVVAGIPRGGVPVAAEVARRLGAPLDVVVVRKVGAPQNPEFALGALAEGDVRVISERTVRSLGLSGAALEALLARAQRQLDDRVRRYRGSGAAVGVSGRTAIVVDDGLATGRSALAAVRSMRQRGAARVVLGVPVAAPSSVETLRRDADEVVCVKTPRDMWAVGLWYEDFRPTSDADVASLLEENAQHRAARAGEGTPPFFPAGRRQGPAAQGAGADELTLSPERAISLGGRLSVPRHARGLVVFAHGSGSSHRSPRNRAVATALGDARFATLLFDLLTPAEEGDRANVFDIPLLASRLIAASTWVGEHEQLAPLPLAYFGASTGAAAALSAAAELGERVRAVISRGGRPDLASGLGAVRAPTLLIVGGADAQVLELNVHAQRQMRAPCELAIVPGASHLFEEPGALEQVARLAIGWLERYL